MRPTRRLLALALVASSALGADSDSGAGLDALLATPVNSASKLERTSMRAPASITVVTAEQIESHGYRTLDEVLESVAGLYLSNDRNYSYVGVRGFSRPTDYNTRILLLIDGHRVNEEVYGMASIGTDLPIDLRAVDRVEVVRGPGSAAFGSSAMLAVVNIVLRAPRSAAADTVVALEAGDFGRVAGTARGAFATAAGDGIAWSAAGFSSAGEDLYFAEYDTPPASDGWTRNTDWDRGRGATLRASWRGVEVSAIATARDKGLPTGSFDSDFDDRRAATRDDWLLVGIDWRRRIARGWELAIHAALSDYAYDGVYPGDGMLYPDSTDAEAWSVETQATWEQRADSRLTAGVEVRRSSRADYRSFDDTGFVYFSGSFPGWRYALYAEQEVQISDQVIATVGGRWDRFASDESRTSPRLALVWLPSRQDALKLLYGRAFRAPNAYERNYEDASEGVGLNPDLDAESIASLEGVWERRLSPTLFGSLSVYRYEMTGLIEQRVDPATGLLVFENVESAMSRGVETELSARWRSGASGFFNAFWQKSTDEEGDRLSNSPAHQVSVGLSAPLGTAWRASTSLLWEPGRRTVQGSDTDAFLRWNASLRWRRPASPWSLELQVRNLTDARYSLPGGLEHRQAALEQAGRGLTLRAEYRF